MTTTAQEFQFPDDDVFRALEPFFPSFISVHEHSWADVRATVPILGLPRKTERAGDMHRALRTNMREFCDLAPDFFELVEEPEGKGLDFLICKTIPEKHFILRWGRAKLDSRPGREETLIVKRNDTFRSTAAQTQGVLFAEMNDDETTQLPQWTLGYVVADDFVAVGQPKWFMEKLVLMREGFDDGVVELARWSRPVEPEESEPEINVRARGEKLAEWRRLLERARRKEA